MLEDIIYGILVVLLWLFLLAAVIGIAADSVNFLEVLS